MINVTVVDDSAQDYALAKSILAYAGHRVQHCPDSASLGQQLDAGSPDAIILGLTDPEANLTLLRSLKADEARRDIPLLVAGSGGLLARPDWVKRLGAHGVVLRPYQMTELLAAIRLIETDWQPL